FMLDVMTPHQGPYYQEGRPPSDTYDPNPIHFLAVRPGVTFHIPVRSLQSEWRTAMVQSINFALTEDGLGGKTNAGYGRFVKGLGQKKGRQGDGQRSRTDSAPAPTLPTGHLDAVLKQYNSKRRVLTATVEHKGAVHEFKIMNVLYDKAFQKEGLRIKINVKGVGQADYIGLADEG
ncbi:MAG: type III-B CRISPR module RAMP protein Cmr6, partial [Fimbriimonadaceae bacterium]